MISPLIASPVSNHDDQKGGRLDSLFPNIVPEQADDRKEDQAEVEGSTSP